jgi:hypothetical protein
LQLTAGASAIDIASTFYGGSRRPITFTMDGEKVRIASDGNVGIGTTSPGNLLHVYSTTSETAIKVTSTASSGDAALYLQAFNATPGNNIISFGDTASGGVGQIVYQHSNDSMQFKTNSSERVRIASDGNVGIGTTSPGVKLHVNGSGYFASTLYVNDTDPTIILQSNSLSGTRYSKVQFVNQPGTVQSEVYAGVLGVGGLYLANYSNNGIFFGVSSTPGTFTERVRIANDGNVGIGTTSPDTLLNVHGANPFIRISNTSGDDHGIKISYGSSDSYGLHLLYNASNALSYIDNTYPVSAGYVYGDIYFRQKVSGTMTTRMTIKADGGKVGIGTTSPGYKLDVNGSCHATCFPTSSDIRFKKKITPLENSLEKIKKLQGVKYEWNEFVNSRRDGYKLNVPIIGLIAQDVEKVIPEIIDLWKLSDDCQDARSIEYPRLIPFLIEAIKEQQYQIEDLKNRLTVLENK